MLRRNVWLFVLLGLLCVRGAYAQDKPADPAAEVPTPDASAAPSSPVPGAPPKVELSPDIPGLTRLAKDGDLWIDAKRKIVVVDGRVVMREGPLEMFACPKGTKEHESIVAVNARPSDIHTGLLAVGALSGTVVKFDPKYVPATGTPVEILVLWKGKDGKNHKVRAQEWIKHSKSGKPMEYEWVFAGSGFWLDEETGRKHYHADAGDFICVSNFPTATLDLPVKSSQENTDLMFEAFTDKIPEKGTKVRLVMIPKPEKKEAAKDDEKPADKK